LQDPRITFFPDRLVRVELTDWAPKKNTEGEKRVRLDFTLPLIDEARDRTMPAWILQPLAAMEAPESVQGKTKLENVVLEGVTVELWDTPKSRSRTQTLAAATLSDFYLVKITRDKQTYPALQFCMNVARTGMLPFCDRYEDSWLWAGFTPVDPIGVTPPAPGVQMTIGDAKAQAANDVENEQTPEEATNNLQAFRDKAIKESNEANAVSIAQGGKPMRPRGFDPKGAA
jgi:hypothetical protein